jgi:ubiquinone/menaquinone biosynthesis C-methylase UbiE
MVSADYNDPTYDYTKYWNNRDYEHLAEIMALKKLLGNYHGDNVIDIGGGFGRLTACLSQHFKSITVYDYSQKLLDEAEKRSRELSIRLEVIKGDIYQLSSTVHESCIRVSHHLEDLPKAISEIKKIIKPGGTFIFEIPNKVHFKAVLKAIITGDFTIFTHDSVSRTFKGTAFLNHHPKIVEKLLVDNGFVIERRLSVSNFRLPLVKKLIPLTLLILLENFLQTPLGVVYFGPSVVYRTKRL